MSPLNTPVVPVKMEQARQHLERWRSTRAHRSPIPEPLLKGGLKQYSV